MPNSTIQTDIATLQAALDKQSTDAGAVVPLQAALDAANQQVTVATTNLATGQALVTTDNTAVLAALTQLTNDVNAQINPPPAGGSSSGPVKASLMRETMSEPMEMNFGGRPGGLFGGSPGSQGGATTGGGWFQNLLGWVGRMVTVLGPLAVPLVEGYIATLPLTPAQKAAIDALLAKLLGGAAPVQTARENFAHLSPGS